MTVKSKVVNQEDDKKKVFKIVKCRWKVKGIVKLKLWFFNSCEQSWLHTHSNKSVTFFYCELSHDLCPREMVYCSCRCSRHDKQQIIIVGISTLVQNEIKFILFLHS